MNKKGHWLFAIIVAALFMAATQKLNSEWYVVTPASIVIFACVIAFYSILPDIDHPAGTMTWVILGIGVFGIVAGIIQLIFGWGNALITLLVAAFLLILVFVSAHFLPHRGIIHSVPIGILASMPLYFLFHSLPICILGYVAWHSHLVGDGYLFKIK